AASLRSMPALSISLWLASSASAGVSFSVCRWNCDRRMGVAVREGSGILPCGSAAGPGARIQASRIWVMCGEKPVNGRRLPRGDLVGAARAAMGCPQSIAAMAAPTRLEKPGCLAAVAVDFDRHVGLDRDAFVPAPPGRGVGDVQVAV